MLFQAVADSSIHSMTLAIIQRDFALAVKQRPKEKVAIRL
jgi:hypothetical protein